MQASRTARSENQIAFAFMSESDVPKPEARLSGPYALGNGPGDNGLIPSCAGRGRGRSGRARPHCLDRRRALLLTLLALFAMLGVFLIFGVLAGHIRIGERVRETDLVKALADNLDDAVLVTRQDGAAIYANRMFRDLAGMTAGGDLRGLDTLFSGEPRAAAAFFRLSRAASRAEPWREEIEISGPARPARGAAFCASQSAPALLPGHERELGPLVLWSIQDVTDERARQASASAARSSPLSNAWMPRPSG